MHPATELDRITPTLALWHAYDPSVKAELFSTAFKQEDRLFLVDPIPLDPAPLRQLTASGTPAAVIVTNENHARAAADFAARFSVPVLAQAASFPDPKPSAFQLLTPDSCPGIEVIEIPGAVAGEVALYLPDDGGTLLLGDALINFEPYGFTLLPAKYCQNHQEMRRSLRRLLSCRAERMFFAHGLPICQGARARLEELLNP